MDDINGIELIRIRTDTANAGNIPANLNLLNQEYVVIANHGKKGTNLVHWQISNNTSDGWYRELYRFPEKLSDGRKWWFEPGELIFVFTGSGYDCFICHTSNQRPQFHFFMNRREYLWNLPDSVATLWNEETDKISSLAVNLKKNPAAIK